MNSIRFEPRPFVEGDRTTGVRVFVDGIDFVELVRAYESPLAEAEGHPDLAGAYAGLSPGRECDREHSSFLGLKSWDRDGRSPVMQCDCGEAGCWPLLCLIEVGARCVAWSDFRQPHRSWDYSGFGPFRFDRDQYVEALAALWAPSPR